MGLAGTTDFRRNVIAWQAVHVKMGTSLSRVVSITRIVTPSTKYALVTKPLNFLRIGMAFVFCDMESGVT